MKLYYAPGACSLAPHIAAREAGLALDIEKVDLRAGKTASGEDFAQINPNGYVPAIRLDGGEVLTEAAAILQYIADQAPAAQLAPPHGSMQRYRLIEWLTFISSEIHKGFSPLFKPATPEAMKPVVIEGLEKRFAYLDAHLATRPYLLGENFTVADAYLFTVMNWTNFHNIDIGGYKNLSAFQARVAGRPKVREAMQAEGLIKQAA